MSAPTVLSRPPAKVSWRTPSRSRSCVSSLPPADRCPAWLSAAGCCRSGCRAARAGGPGGVCGAGRTHPRGRL